MSQVLVSLAAPKVGDDEADQGFEVFGELRVGPLNLLVATALLLPVCIIVVKIKVRLLAAFGQQWNDRCRKVRAKAFDSINPLDQSRKYFQSVQVGLFCCQRPGNDHQ